MKSHRQAKFDAVLDSVYIDLYRYAYWRCRDRLLAEELVQETLMRVWRRIDQLREADSAKAWVFTIFRREHARHFERERPEFTSAGELDEYNTPAVEANPIDDLAMREALAQVEAKYAEPLVLQVLGGFSCAEIAEISGLSETAVMTRLFRARKKIRAIMEERAEPRRHEPVRRGASRADLK